MRILIIFIYLFSYLVFCHEYEKNNIIVDHPILKINSDRSKVGAGYMKIINNSNSDIYFSKISSEISKKLEIHEIIEENNIYKMRPIENALFSYNVHADAYNQTLDALPYKIYGSIRGVLFDWPYQPVNVIHFEESKGLIVDR